MKKRIFRNTMLTAGAATACCVLAAALLLRPSALQLALLAGVGAAALGLCAPAARRSAQKELQPLEELLRDVERLHADGTRLAPEEYEDALPRELAGRIDALSEAALREHARTNRLLDSLCDGFALLDGDGRVCLVNAAACEAFGAPRETLLGRPLPRTPDTEAVCGGVDEALRAGQALAELPLPGRRVGEVRLTRTLLDDASHAEGRQGVALSIVDVTAQREAAQTRRAFFRDAAAILRGPTENLKGFVGLLNSPMPLGGNKQEELARRILRETDRLGNLIGKVIVLSRLERGDLRFPREPLALDAIVRESCEKASAAAREQGAAFSYDLQPCTLAASRWEMTQLTGELLSNAVQYCPAGGRIAVTLCANAGAPCLRVFSSGEPIPPEHARHVFERFYRAEKMRGPASGGAGMGLAIVRHIAAGYGALATVEPGADGNEFRVQFPAAAAQG